MVHARRLRGCKGHIVFCVSQYFRRVAATKPTLPLTPSSTEVGSTRSRTCGPAFFACNPVEHAGGGLPCRRQTAGIGRPSWCACMHGCDRETKQTVTVAHFTRHPSSTRIYQHANTLCLFLGWRGCLPLPLPRTTLPRPKDSRGFAPATQQPAPTARMLFELVDSLLSLSRPIYFNYHLKFNAAPGVPPDGRSAGVHGRMWRHRQPPGPAGSGSCRRRRAACPTSASLPSASSSSSSSTSVEGLLDVTGGSSRRRRRRPPAANGAAPAVCGDAAEKCSGRSSSRSRSAAPSCVDESRFEPTVCLAAASRPASAPAVEDDEQPSFVHDGVEGVENRRRRRGGDRTAEPSAGLMISMRQLSVLGAVAGLAAAAFDYKHGMAAFHWFQDWVRRGGGKC